MKLLLAILCSAAATVPAAASNCYNLPDALSRSKCMTQERLDDDAAGKAAEKKAADEKSRDERIAPGKTIELSKDAFACRDAETLYKVDDLLAMHDVIASMKLVRRSHCLVKKKGASFVIEEVSYRYAASCVHVLEEPDCIWIPNDSVN